MGSKITLLGSNFDPVVFSVYDFWQERDWNCEFMVSPKHTFSYEIEGAPLWPPKITYFCNFRTKWPEIRTIYLAKYQIFSGKGVLSPCDPRQGISPLDPREYLAQALGLLASLTVAWGPPQVDNLIERIWTGVLPSDHLEQRCSWTKTEFTSKTRAIRSLTYNAIFPKGL